MKSIWKKGRQLLWINAWNFLLQLKWTKQKKKQCKLLTDIWKFIFTSVYCTFCILLVCFTDRCSSAKHFCKREAALSWIWGTKTFGIRWLYRLASLPRNWKFYCFLKCLTLQARNDIFWLSWKLDLEERLRGLIQAKNK